MTTPNLPRNDDGTLAAYAWPGGYPLYYITKDGGVLCPADANMADREGLTNDERDEQWYILSADIHWEGEPLYCDHCGERIPSAYMDAWEDRSGRTRIHIRW